jgi:hypothetical protein
VQSTLICSTFLPLTLHQEDDLHFGCQSAGKKELPDKQKKSSSATCLYRSIKLAFNVARAKNSNAKMFKKLFTKNVKKFYSVTVFSPPIQTPWGPVKAIYLMFSFPLIWQQTTLTCAGRTTTRRSFPATPG